MPDSPIHIIKLTRRLSLVIGLMIALLGPVFYFALSYQYHATGIDTEAQINAEITSQFVGSNTGRWRFMEERLISLLDLKSIPFLEHKRRVLDVNLEELASNGLILPEPLLVRTSPFYDAGRLAGFVEISQTLRPLLWRTFFVLLVSALAGGGFYLFIRRLPLQALEEAFGRLEESRLLLESVFRSFRDAVVVVRLEAREVIACNPATAHLLGWTLADLRQMEPARLSEVLPGEVFREPTGEDSAAFNLRRTRMKRSNGDTFPVEYSRAVFLDRNKHPVAVIVVRDITERVLQEERILNINRELESRVEARTRELSDSEKRLRYLFKRSPSPVLILAASTAEILDANDAALQLLECGLADCRGIKLSAFVSPESHGHIDSLMMSPADMTHLDSISEARFVTHLGNPRVISVHIRRLTAGGEPIVFCSLFDVTETVHLRSQWRMSLERLVQAEKMEFLGTMVSGFAHDINNPNQLIRTNVQMLAEVCRDLLEVLDHCSGVRIASLGGLSVAEAKESIPSALADIESGSNRIARIIRNLMGYAREHDSMALGDVKVNKVVEDAVMLLKHRIHQMTDHFSITLDDHVPSIRGNAQSLEQIVINLLVNALESLTDATGRVAIATRYESGKEKVLILVEDNGTGMSQETLEQSRKPFFTTKESTGGSGLGLSITQMLVQEHGGSLDITSAPGTGTTITVTLPVS